MIFFSNNFSFRYQRYERKCRSKIEVVVLIAKISCKETLKSMAASS